MIYDEDYWKNRERETFKDTLEILTDDFGLPISGADTIFIRKYVSEFIGMWKNVPKKQRVKSPMNLAAESAGKFIINFYGFYNLRQMNRAIYNGKKIQI